MATVNPKWRAGLDSSLDSTSVSNGNILITTDSGRLLIDYGGNRIEVTDFVKDTEANILATVTPLSKFYFATDTYKFYYYDTTDGWVCTSADIDLSSYVTLTGSQALTNKTYNGYTLAAACAKGLSDSSSASALGSSDTNVPTVRDVYYGLPTINNSHAYTSSTAIYAPTAGGTSGYVLIGAGTTTAPTWTAQSNIAAGSATNDGDGNEISATYAPLASPALTGTPTAPTAVSGTSTTQIATTAFVTTAVANGVASVDLSDYVTLTGAEALTNKTYNGYTLAAACAKGVSDSSVAGALSSTDTNVPTVRDVYYGLPTINGSHAYTSSTNIYAPTSVGISGYMLQSAGTGAPSWVAQSTIAAGSAVNDGAGNEISSTYAPLASPALTGTPTAPTAVSGTNTTQIATTAFVTTAVNAAVLDGIDSIDMSSYVTLTGAEALTNKTYEGYTLAAACAKSLSDSSTASALSSTDTNVPTVRDIYYGLPTINGSHSYTSSTNIYAPTSVGTSGYVLQSSGSGAPSWVAQSTLSVGSATSDGSGNVIASTYAPLASPALTGTPTATTAAAGTSTTQIATTAFVSTAVTNAIAGVTQFSYSVVTSLPTTGVTGVIYLIADSHDDSNDNYDEYIWLEDSLAYEKIGNTDMDLSDYVTLTGSEALTNKTYNGYTLAAACAKGVSDSSSASALSSTDTNVATVRDIYYGLPTINGSHSYTSSTSIYAPTSAGTSGYILQSAGSGAPSWVAASTLTVSNATTADSATTATTATSATTAGTADLATTITATANTTTKAYLVGVTATGTTPIYDTGVYLNTTAGSIYATTYNGYTLAAACAKSVTDVSTATAISSTSTNLVTARTVYYGLPTINGSHSYTSSTSIYAPTSVGTSGYILQSSGTGAPSWVAASTLTVSSATTADSATTATSATTADSATTASTATLATTISATAATTTKAYLVGVTASGTTPIYDTDVYLNTTAGSIYATTYNGYTLAAACAKSVTDNTTATAITSTDSNLITAEAIYYGTPTINGAHDYTSDTTIYAPTSAGTSGYFLRSTAGTPGWVSATNVQRYIGIGYGTSTGGTTMTVTLSNYTYVTGGIMTVTFSGDVGAGATLNVNSKGAKAVYYQGAAIESGVINSGDTATFVYTGTYWYLIACDNGLGNYFVSGEDDS